MRRRIGAVTESGCTAVICAQRGIGVRMGEMRLFSKIAITTVLLAASVCGAFAQNGFDNADATLQRVADKTQVGKKNKNRDRLTSDDRLSLIASALDARVQRQSEPDCSHLVHAIYAAAGFPYDYTPSSDLYDGAASFQRVKAPLPGDLVVWRGHVGIVIKPSQHIFFSYLSSGPGTDDYEAAYWKHRGRPRFYSYVRKNSPISFLPPKD